ncbi:hypothetical protein QYE76_069741 [Lolium multiflorum]|uniref:Reverse transcriptase domain-containing protein n=1 Tax=Lolium multiflorum TaxID=4521 RepID=A0AAD8SGX1_LOLMU|nr:hypothetical protein QYE76_069741 [Lolium multiflorum]
MENYSLLMGAAALMKMAVEIAAVSMEKPSWGTSLSRRRAGTDTPVPQILASRWRRLWKCLKDQIGRNVHAYVDDIAVMTRKGSDLISDLKETFENLRRYKMMLNPLKCVFGVPAGKLLGFIVSHRGIEVNPEKIKAILNIKRPTCLKDLQRLTGCVASISRFVSRLGEKALPLYKMLKKTDKLV